MEITEQTFSKYKFDDFDKNAFLKAPVLMQNANFESGSPSAGNPSVIVNTDVRILVQSEIRATVGSTLASNTTKSILADASKAAFNAADDAGSIFVKSKHLNIGSGNFAKFTTSDINVARGWLQQALRSPNATFLSNPQIPNTFRVFTKMGTTVGTKGKRLLGE